MGGRLPLSVAVALVAIALPFTTAAPACAGEGGSAALVVDTGADAHRLCVALPDRDVSGLDLIVLANEQHGLDYRFGFGGEAVCMLAGVGSDGEDCFEHYPDFWGYWRGDGSGGWQWSGSGAGSTRVADGDVEGWSWGSGNDGSSHPRPPETTFSTVCPAVGEADERADPPPRPANQQDRSRTRPRSDAPSTVPETSAPVSDPGSRPPPGSSPPNDDKRDVKDARRHRGATELPTAAATTPTPSPDAVLAGDDVTPPSQQRSLPATGLVAMILAVALGAAGFVIARRRRGPA